MSLLGRFGILWSGVVAAGLSAGFAAERPHLGPLFDSFPLTLEPGTRTEALGPFFYIEQEELQRTWSIPPLLSRTWDPDTDFTEVDLAYPLITYRRFGTEYRWQVVQVFSFAGGRDQQEKESRRFTLFPIYFQQRSPVPADNYTAVFPLYGHLENRLFRDDIFFVLFPIYGRSRSRDVVTDNYLYPFFHLRRGDSLRGWQFWPLAGHEHKDPLTRTNGFGDPELEEGHDDKFVLWPVLFQNRSGIGSQNPATERGVLPFYSDLRSPQRDSTTVLWPFISHVTDRDKKYKEWDVPWPLIVFARGEGKTISRVWPFCSWATNSSLESDFYLWPLYKYQPCARGRPRPEAHAHPVLSLFRHPPAQHRVRRSAPPDRSLAAVRASKGLQRRHQASALCPDRNILAKQSVRRAGLFPSLVGLARRVEPPNRRGQPVVSLEFVPSRDDASVEKMLAPFGAFSV